jgi:hypothetical protein
MTPSSGRPVTFCLHLRQAVRLFRRLPVHPAQGKGFHRSPVTCSAPMDDDLLWRLTTGYEVDARDTSVFRGAARLVPGRR